MATWWRRCETFWPSESRPPRPPGRLLLEHNLALLAGVPALRALGCPVLIGSSRKRFIGELTGLAAPADRVSGTVAACLATFRRGATIFRVHDVGALVSALKVAEAIERAGPAADSPPGRQNPCG